MITHYLTAAVVALGIWALVDWFENGKNGNGDDVWSWGNEDCCWPAVTRLVEEGVWAKADRCCSWPVLIGGFWAKADRYDDDEKNDPVKSWVLGSNPTKPIMIPNMRIIYMKLTMCIYFINGIISN